jgi:hypothetical protein
MEYGICHMGKDVRFSAPLSSVVFHLPCWLQWGERGMVDGPMWLIWPAPAVSFGSM